MHRKQDMVFLAISVCAMAAVAVVSAVHICIVALKYMEKR